MTLAAFPGDSRLGPPPPCPQGLFAGDGMKSVPWHLRGIAPHVRDTAREAARRSGLSVAAWLNSAILNSAAEDGVSPQLVGDSQDRPGQTTEELAAINERLVELTRHIGHLMRRSRAPARADQTQSQLADAIARLDQRLDQLLREGRHVASEIEPRPANVDQAFATRGQERKRAAYSGGDVASEVDRMAAEIAARQRVLDGDFAASPGADLTGVEEQLRRINTQIEALQRPCRADEVVQALRHDLADIGRTLTEAMPRQAIDALEGEVRSLATRIDAGRQAGVDLATTPALERGLAEVRDALRALTPAESLVGFDAAIGALSQKIDLVTANAQDPATLRQIEAAITDLRGSIGQVASGETLTGLASEIRALTDKVDSAMAATTSNGVLTALEQRIAAIADAIEAIRTEGQRPVPAQFDHLMSSLTEHLERLQLSRGQQVALGNLEDRITKLVEKLDASEARLGHLEAIERGMAELLVHLEELRANHAGTGLRAAPAPAATMPNDTIKLEVAEITRRNEDQLEAVHTTIGDVVDRLALIEGDMRAGGHTEPPPFVAASPAAPAPDPTSVDAARPAAAPGPFGRPDATKPTTPAATKRLPIDSGLAPDYPLEPGSGPPIVRMATSPTDRIAASEAALFAARAATRSSAPEAKPVNYLQAARRAAKAAESIQRDDAVNADRAAPQDFSSRLAKALKPLLIAFSVVVLVAAALRLAVNVLDSGRFSLSETPAASEQITVAELREPAPFAGPIAASEPAKPPALSSLPATSPAVAIAPENPALPSSVDRQIDFTGSVPARLETPANAPKADPAPPATAAIEPGSDQLPATIGAKGLITAALTGDPAAAYEVAVRFAEGRGVPQSFKAAAAWFERAAKRGLAPAQFRLGSLYEKGNGVTKDLQEARRLYIAAAEKGNAKAMHNIAVLYAEGIDGKPDYNSAVNWFRKAANYGLVDSQYNLAVLFARGIGVQQNLPESFKWFALAARSGDPEAIKKRDEVAARLDQQTLIAARLAAQSWTAEREPEEATTVKAPAGGWDEVTPVVNPKSRPRAQTSRSSALL